MGGIYIEGLKKPKLGCLLCMFDVYGSCLINSNMKEAGKVTHSCPLTSVPDHGRLIDADKLAAAIQEEIDGWRAAGCDVSCYEAIRDNYILEAPTVIRADGRRGK